jgi:hypothetical protein
MQKWFLVEVLEGADIEASIEARSRSGASSFSTCAWLDIGSLVPLAPAWRRGAYAHITREFRPIIARLRAAWLLEQDARGLAPMHGTPEWLLSLAPEVAVNAVVQNFGAAFVLRRAAAALQGQRQGPHVVQAADEVSGELDRLQAAVANASHGRKEDVQHGDDTRKTPASVADARSEPHASEAGADDVSEPGTANGSAQGGEDQPSASQSSKSEGTANSPEVDAPRSEAPSAPAHSLNSCSQPLPEPAPTLDPADALPAPRAVPSSFPTPSAQVTRGMFEIPAAAQPALSPPALAHTTTYGQPAVAHTRAAPSNATLFSPVPERPKVQHAACRERARFGQ